MRAVLAALLAFFCFAAFAEENRPGYGVVEAVTPVKSEPSASAGSSIPSQPSSQSKGKYRVKVRLDDGTIQYRTLKKREFFAGDRVLLTNAGDVVAE
jgi:hypothetical protein